MFRITSAALVVLASVWPCASASAQAALRYKFTKGQTNVYDLRNDTKIAQSVMGKAIDIEARQALEIAHTVDDVLADGGGRITIRVARVKITLKGPVEADFDSANLKDAGDNPTLKSMAGVVKALAKVECTAVQSPTGELTDIKFADAVVKELRAVPGLDQGGDLLSEAGLRQMIAQSSVVLPKDPIAVGGSWTHKAATRMPFGKLSSDLKYTYQGTDVVQGKTLQKIAVTPTSAIAADADAPVTLKIAAQKGTGVVLFDNDLGRVQEIQQTQFFEMSIGTANLSIDQNITQQIAVKLVQGKK